MAGGKRPEAGRPRGSATKTSRLLHGGGVEGVCGRPKGPRHGSLSQC